MKQIFITLLLGSLFISCSNSSERPKAELTIHATHLDDGTLTLSSALADTTISSVELVNGQAQITLDLPYPQLIVIEADSLVKPIVFYADITEMNLTIDAENTPPTFELIGSKYQDSMEVFSDAQQANRAYMEQYYPAYREAQQANDSMTMNLISKKLDSAYFGFDQYTKDFAARNGLVGATIAMRYIYQAEYDDVNKIYENIPAIYATHPTVEQFKERVDILKNTQIGMRFTDITQNDTTGKPLSISSIEGDYILIDFWASWCGPCRAANPDLVKIYQEYHEKGFEIVGVSLDQKEGSWKKAIIDDNLTWYQMSDLKGWQNEGAAAYAIRSIPQSVVIDNQGFIVQKNLDPEALRAFLSDKL